MDCHEMSYIGSTMDDFEIIECPVCGADAKVYTCPDCGGEGFREYIDTPECWGEDCPSEENHLVECPGCGGDGGWIACASCARSAAPAAEEE